MNRSLFCLIFLRNSKKDSKIHAKRRQKLSNRANMMTAHSLTTTAAAVAAAAKKRTMSKPFDYSKWDNIELSDDEDDVHPNIDKESWFRMKHRSRVEREETEEADKKKIHQEVRVSQQEGIDKLHTVRCIVWF